MSGASADDGVKTTSGNILPDNVIGGIFRGAGAVATGVGVGAMTLVAAPIVGLREGGLVGGVVGIGKGVVGAAACVVGGTVGGAVLVAGGAVNTPGAIKAMIDDDDLHGKETIDLSTVEVENTQERARSRRMRDTVEAQATDEADIVYEPREDVKDKTYYDALGVKPSAKKKVIKRAYYKLAMKTHPDKGGDKEAFQKIGEAYQVLSDPSKRKKYDEGGLEALKEQPLADSAVVFAMIFGEEKFAHLCGELTATMAMQLGDTAGDERKTLEKLAQMQTEREQRLAKLLALRLDKWRADKEAFVKEAVDEWSSLSQVSLGPQMLISIGIMYELTGDRELGVRGRGTRGFFAGWRSTAHKFDTQARALEGAVYLSSKGEKTAAEVQANLYNVMAMDIESTVGRAALLCLHDSSVDRETRQMRARGIVKLGRIFQGKCPGQHQGDPTVELT